MAKTKRELTERFSGMNEDDIKAKVKSLNEDVKTIQEKLDPKMSELSELKKYMKENNLLCQHETLTRESERLYICANEDCKQRVVIRSFR